ncbi:hypothetical protein LB504_003615 [Fusarium proliferatum]|nr:hypothetical protein LB504_003615 [Fusarium proliferatum]
MQFFPDNCHPDLGCSDTHAPVPWGDHGSDYGVGVQGEKKKSTYVTRGRQWQTTTRYYRHLTGGGVGELVAHEAEKRETIIHSCFSPLCDLEISIRESRSLRFSGLISSTNLFQYSTTFTHTKHALSTYFLLLSFDRRL